MNEDVKAHTVSSRLEEVTLQAISQHLEEVMGLLGIEKDENNEDTPKRIAKMLRNDLFMNLHASKGELDKQITTFPSPSYSHPMPVTMLDIPFNSTCEHHWLPFFGTAKITYVPRDVIIGLSKIPRIVKFFSKKPQTQERLTKEIGDYLFEVTGAESVEVELTATHTCVMCRGVELPSSTKTVYKRVMSDEIGEKGQ